MKFGPVQLKIQNPPTEAVKNDLINGTGIVCPLDNIKIYMIKQVMGHTVANLIDMFRYTKPHHNV